MVAVIMRSSSQRSQSERSALLTPANRSRCKYLVHDYYSGEANLGRVVWCYERNESQHLKGSKVSYHERLLSVCDVKDALMRLAADHNDTARAIELFYGEPRLPFKDVCQKLHHTDATVAKMLHDGIDLLVLDLWQDE